jgi:RimJ/RimL family protein N-acetyltransferase
VCCRAKDEGTTQGSCGFRLCGVLVHGAAGVWREDRHWGKRLTPDTLRQALTRFADNGAVRRSAAQMRRARARLCVAEAGARELSGS